MSCLHCDNCLSIEGNIPECFTGNITIDSVDIAGGTDVLAVFEKPGGGVISFEKPTEAGGEFIIDFTADMPAEAPDFFIGTAGTYKFYITDPSTGEDIQLTDGNGVQSYCALLTFKKGLPDSASFPFTFIS